ncbi:Fructosamine kinase-domain-containing protein [Xylariaceae sp. FL1019]|nr:Fructosamine kinase-domain-containing protein [Xylariaceae sp. FL1019]
MALAIGSRHIDERVIGVLPNFKHVTSVQVQGRSSWAEASRIDVEQLDGSSESYFMKVSKGHHGRSSLKGEFESTAAIHAFTPDFCPKPIAWGSFNSDADTHFYICKFYEFARGLPHPTPFCAKLAELHLRSSDASPDGEFGFHVTTYNGDIPQDNTWSKTWEAFFAKAFRHVLRIREERAGHCADLEMLLPPFFGKVIPRLLRPLETGGNSIKPSLVHGDMWCGNAAIINKASGEGIVYDPSSFWAHNEYELGNWRPERNRFSQEYFDAYHSHIPISSPVCDYDDRNALYAIRFNLNAATLFPDEKQYLISVIEEMHSLVKKFTEGFTES